MKIQIISLFNDPAKSYLSTSMMRKATDIGVVEFEYIDLRDFGLGPRKQVDDTPYGGGDGMLLMVEPLHKAIMHAKSKDPQALVYLTTPKGKKLDQNMSKSIAKEANGMIIVCGRYEGEDARVMKYVDQPFSIGDFILTGGELPALVLVDSVVRLLPGVLGGETSAEEESFSDGDNLEHPHYTRPEVYDDQQVPDVLLSGNHAEIAKWRKEKSS
ncbi:MAG: tRNA (guanosine(37)-N1)-methyltransferase TrmD [Patescibacteria group bacterium]